MISPSQSDLQMGTQNAVCPPEPDFSRTLALAVKGALPTKHEIGIAQS